MSRKHSITIILLFALSAIVAACSSDPSGPETNVASPTMGGMGESGSDTSFGHPGSPNMANRTISITQLDSPSFDPTSITVSAGETIEFEITNDGASDHEFVLGDQETQDEHAADMEEMGMDGMGADDDNVVSVEPGTTKSLIWTFTDPGTVLYGCHVNSHYDAGMVGIIRVEG